MKQTLGGEDAAWLQMEEATNPMIVNAVLELAAPLPMHRVHALAARLAENPRFRARVVVPSGLHARVPSWSPAPGFDLERHVEHVTLAAPGDDVLRAFIGNAVGKLLDPREPLWHLYVIDRPGMGTTLLFRVHHAVADGFALLAVLLSVADAKRDASPTAAPRPRAARDDSALAAVKAGWRLVALPADPKTLLKGQLGTEKKVAWSSDLDLERVKRIARATRATVNDVLVAAVAGALRRYLQRRSEPVDTLALRAMVPVNLREDVAAATLGNRFGLVVLGLPIGITDPLDRVRAAKQRMDRLKASPEAVVAHALLGAIGRAPRRVRDFAVTFFGKKASLVLTNVPGPRLPVELAGVRVSRIVFWVPQSARMGLGISMFSYAGEVTIGVLSDAALVPDPESLIADLLAEVTDLERALATRAVTTIERTQVDGAPARQAR